MQTEKDLNPLWSGVPEKRKWETGNAKEKVVCRERARQISRFLSAYISDWPLNHTCLEQTQLSPTKGFPGGTSGKEPTCQCSRPKRCRFDPWVKKIPWRRAWRSTPVFLPIESPWTGEPGRLQSMGSQGVGHDWVTKHTTLYIFQILFYHRLLQILNIVPCAIQ